jgi:hypothetical protein
MIAASRILRLTGLSSSVEPFGLLPSLDTATQRRDSESPYGLPSVATSLW